MSLLDNVVASVLKNSLGSAQNTAQNSDALGGLLGSLIGGQSQSQGGLDGLLGQVVSSQLGGGQSQGGLGSVLGGLLGGNQSRQNIPAGDLGSILGQVIGGQKQQSGGFNKNTLLLVLIPIVLSYIQKNGGLSGVLTKFQGSGLGNKAQSWVNIDTDNDGLDAQDVLGLFGQDEINRACEQTGASQNEVCQGIAELLPQVVNDLTPNGDLSNESEVNNEISQILQQFQK